jgi:hypothetical protein
MEYLPQIATYTNHKLYCGDACALPGATHHNGGGRIKTNFVDAAAELTLKTIL